MTPSDHTHGSRATDGFPHPDELSPQGGSWSGLLFDNPSIGLPPGLTWSFTFAFGRVAREWGKCNVALTVEWVPLPGAAWSGMAGHEAAAETFGDPIECSAYFFDHYAYDAVRLRVLEQAGSRLRVGVEARGDRDGLGVPDWRAEQWLDFEGIYVQLDGVETAGEAARRLAERTDHGGLEGRDNGHNFKFVAPAA